MTTLYDYLARLTVDAVPLVWSDRPLLKSQLDAAAGAPYVRVYELDEVQSVALYQNVNVLEMIVDVHIYQAPTSAGTMPSKESAMRLYFDIWNAHSEVDAWTYDQPLTAIFPTLGIPPRYDEDSGGLSGMIRFRLLFPRG